MDWDTYSLEKPKYPPQHTHKCDVISPISRNRPSVLLKDTATTSKLMEDNLRVNSWRNASPLESYSHLLSDRSIATELDEVKKQNDSVLRVVSSLQKKVDFLEAQLKKQDQIIEINSTQEEEIEEFRSLFGLPPLSKKVEDISFRDLEGILNNLSRDGEDSVEVIRSIRG
ncbi:hypothetical protein [Methanoregula sp.]|uniref:hypothetical protein n=1 Tax=Methanoregula sp. TaxID=2052170 RepID=UPI0035698D81